MYFSGHIKGLNGTVMHLIPTEGKNAIRAKGWERCQDPTEQIHFTAQPALVSSLCLCVHGWLLSVKCTMCKRKC